MRQHSGYPVEDLAYEEPIVPVEMDEHEIRPGMPDSLESPPKDRALTYGLIFSVLLHILCLLVIPFMGGTAPSNPVVKPGEQVTRVRMVETPLAEGKKEPPPPDQPAAISHQDHTAERERIPRLLPQPKAPVGKIEPYQPKIASLPPSAPEEVVKPQEEPETPQPKPKIERTEKKQKKQHTPDKPRVAEKPRAPGPSPKNQPAPKELDLRPTPGETAKALGWAGGPQDFFPDGNPDETVVDINTRDALYFSYLMHLKDKIQAVWVYPAAASRQGIGGGLVAEFSIDRTGKLLDVRLLDSSGHAILDESAIRAIKNAAPYHPFPERWSMKRLRVRAQFVYITSNFFGRTF